MNLRIGITGYGNLGKGVEKAIAKSSDASLAAVFTRRNPEQLDIATKNVPVYSIDAAANYKDEIDVMILCGGSATDLPVQGPVFAKDFCTIDSFDTHAKIPEYYKVMDKTAKENGNLSIISVGWDPGLFSLNRAYAEAVLPDGQNYTFWGRGVSQGHSDAIRRIDGVKNAIQYTVPVPDAVAAARSGENPTLTTRQKHTRECFVVAEDGADKARIEAEIKNMPNYFSDYDTTVTFISEDELKASHSAMPHGGFVIRSGVTGESTKQIIEYSLRLESNPEFTGSVLLAYARAAYRLHKEGISGAKTVLDIAPAYLSPAEREELIKNLL